MLKKVCCACGYNIICVTVYLLLAAYRNSYIDRETEGVYRLKVLALNFEVKATELFILILLSME